MSLLKVNAALITAYQALALGLPTAYEMAAFTPPTDASWVHVHNAPADLRLATLGSGGQDSYVGVFSVDIYAPRHTGTKFLLDKAWQVLTALPAGKRVSYQGQEVRVKQSVPSPIRSAEDFADNAITVSVYWEARFTRA